MLTELATNLIFPLRMENRSMKAEDVERLLLAGCSFVRWGDGEVAILNGKDIAYQKYSRALSVELESVLLQPGENVLVGAPYRFTCQSVFSLILRRKFGIWAASRAFYISYFHKPARGYADAFGFRQESEFCYLSILKKLIANCTSVSIIGTNSEEIERFCSSIDGNRPCEKIYVPPSSCYSVVDELEDRLNYKTAGDLVLLACGPTAKALVGRCGNRGAQLIDVGHLFDHLGDCNWYG